MVFFSFGFRNGDKNVCLPELAAASAPSGCSCSNFVKSNGGSMVG